MRLSDGVLQAILPALGCTFGLQRGNFALSLSGPSNRIAGNSFAISAFLVRQFDLRFPR